MPAGGQCYEPSPFFPTIPRHVTRVGISRRRNLLLRPDWLVTGGLLFGAVIILCICVTLLVSVHSQTHTIRCSNYHLFTFIYQSISTFRSCFVNMDGLRSSQSQPGIVCHSCPTKWTTTRQKDRGWCHWGRSTETIKLKWHKTPFRQVQYSNPQSQRHDLCSFISTLKLNAIC